MSSRKQHDRQNRLCEFLLAFELFDREESLRKVDDAWVREGLTVALLVPSAAIRGEWNVLLNPAHKGFSRVKFESPEPFVFDSRMFR